MQKLKILTFNIHKGRALLGRSSQLDAIKKWVVASQADIVCLQEVVGERNGVLEAQFEALSDSVWSYHAYGKNAVYTGGHHGNAILSMYPVTFHNNHDLTLHRFEMRGMLHVTLDQSHERPAIHILTTHLNLRERDRLKQLDRVLHYIKEFIPPLEPIILCGDFNDWTGVIHERVLDLGFDGVRLPSFPSVWPLLRLDRVYTRGWIQKKVEVFQGRSLPRISDHLPILAEIELG